MSNPRTASRIAAARARAWAAKAVLLGAAALAFVWAMLLARAMHPGKASGTSSASSGSANSSDSSFDSEEDSGSGQLAPAQGTPQISTGSS
jgi:hypothetical protein